MNEEETRAELIDPALKDAGWGDVDGSRVRREYITQGRLLGSGKRSKRERADYVLTYRGKKLAVIEAKRRDLPDTEGVAQAKKYSSKLHVRYTYSTNGVGIYQIDMETGKEKYVSEYPSPDELWDMTFSEQNEWRDRFSEVPFNNNGGQWELRYYKYTAIDRILEAVAAGQERILLTLATGTGKTSVAFEVAWKLFHSRWTLARDGARRPRILFLADRNILADQAYNSFSAFEDGALVRIAPDQIRKKGRVPKNGSVFFSIFQTFMSGRDEEDNSTPNYENYPPDFFDFIVIDECHRGGANDEGNWRGILEHFSPAVQLGLTATPKRENNADTYAYFGEPVYTYSLKEGVNDGFLTPFKVRQYATTLDDYVYTSDDVVVEGEVETGETFKEPDFNRTIEIEEREKYRVKVFMDAIDQNQKTLVFCANQGHALLVRDLINQMKVSTDPDYCVRVTADDGKDGEQFLRIFQDNDKTIPTILTTSQKLSTGVDARNIRNIVLMRPINSMIEFKQIIGRGTRLYEDKDFFTIHDFVKAHENFEDETWDGDPVDPEPVTPHDGDGGGTGGDVGPVDPPPPPREKIKIKLADGKERTIQHISATMYYSPDGTPISANQFIERIFGEFPALFKDEDELRKLWGLPDTRKALLDHLAELGYGIDQFDQVRQMINAEKSDLYDILAWIAYALAPITRQERVDNRKEQILDLYDDKLQTFLEFVLDQYVKEGVGELDDEKLTGLVRAKYFTMEDAAKELGGISQIRDTFIGFQQHLYR
jgi:type I restriction enzyme, R subunit